MASFNQTAKSASLLCAAALMAASGLQTPALAGNNSAKNCENGKLIGTFAIQAQSNSKFIKKDDGKLQATESSQPSSPSDKGVFELYSLKGMPGATDQTLALRSTRNPNKWWRVRNNNHSVKLEDYQCRSDRTSTTFIGRGAYGAMALQSRKNNQWIYVADSGKLKAASDSLRNESVFKLISIGQANNPGNNPNPTPPDNTPPTINGWWKGNDNRLFYIATQGSNVTMKGFQPTGGPLSISTGLLNGRLLNGNWSNHCYGARGTFAFSYTNGKLRKIGGNITTSTLTRISTPSNVNLNAQPSCSGNGGSGGTGGGQPSQQPPNLTGWWKGNDSRLFYITTQGSNVTMKGFQPSGGPLSISTGLLNGTLMNGNWNNHCYGARGTFAFSYANGGLRKVGGNITTSTLTRISTPSNVNLNAQPSCSGNGGSGGTGGGQPTQPQPQPQPEAKKQKLTLKREIWVYDQNVFGSNQRGTTYKQNSITVERPEQNAANTAQRLAMTKALPSAKYCVGNTNSVDNASVYIDKNGNAFFNFNVQLREGSCTGGVPIGSKNYTNFLTAAPGQTTTRWYQVNGTGGSKVKITYTLTNRTE